MKRFSILLLYFILFINLFSQNLEWIRTPGGQIRNVVIHPRNDNVIITYGFEGVMYITLDKGENLKLIKRPSIRDGISQVIIDKNENFKIFINNGKYYVSEDKGQTWYTISSYSSSYPFFVINPAKSSTIFIKKDTYEIWKTTNSGETWEMKLKTDRQIGSIVISELDTNTVYISASGKFYRSTDGGNTWEVRIDLLPMRIDGYNLYVHPLDKNIVYFQDKFLYYTNDGFISIKKISPSFVDIFSYAYAVDPVDTNTIYIAPQNGIWPTDGVILKTTDGGSNWFAADNGIKRFYNKARIFSITISPQNPEEIYISVGNSEGAYRTTNGGESWERAAIFNNQVISMFAPKDNPEYLFVESPYDHYYYSTDKGENWADPYFEEEPASVSLVNSFSFNPANPDSGFLASGKDLLVTTDRGKTWNKTGILAGVNQITYHTYNPNVMFASVYPNDSLENGLYRSADGGVNWEYITIYVDANLKFSEADPNVIYEFWYNGVSKSTDMGLTWFGIDENLPQDPDDRRFSALAVGRTNADLVYLGQKAIGDSLGSLRMSTDGGETWRRIDSKLKEYEVNLDIGALLLDVDRENRLFVGCLQHGQPGTESFSKGGLYLTENNGESWRKIYDGYVDYIYSDEATPPTIYFNTKYGLWKFVDTLTTSVKANFEIVREFKLFQNYPNPFNPSTIIEYSVDTPGYVKIEVYNSLGQKIRELVNEYKNKGNYRVEFNASNLPSGIYYYRLYSGMQTLVKKMLLLK